MACLERESNKEAKDVYESHLFVVSIFRSPVKIRRKLLVEIFVILIVFGWGTGSVEGQTTESTEPPVNSGGANAASGRAVDEVPTLGARNYPLCITSDRYQEYATPEMKKGKSLARIFQLVLNSRLGSTRTKTASGGVDPSKGDLQQVHYSRISTNLPGSGHSQFQYLHQWMHIKITTHKNITVLVVQAVNFPFAMAWGNFDLDLGGKDCGPDINVNKVDTGRALDYDGHATVIPCTRRSYLHLQHPNVYVYNGPPRREFHINFNYEDLTGRELKLLQFLIITIRTSAPMFYKTPVLDHYNYHDSPDGMPYPSHPDLKKTVTMHSKTLPLVIATNGEFVDLPYNKDYDDCVKATDAVFASDFRDKDQFISEYVCKKPSRHKMDFGNSFYHPVRSTEISAGAIVLCTTCGPEKNEFTRESVRRLIGRTYTARRFHGYSMIFGNIAAVVVSIFIARYFKETGGCGLLVGWWLWVHHFLTIVSIAAVWLGVGIVIYFPQKSEDIVPVITEPRRALNIIHMVIGTVCFILFHLAWLSGPFRPERSKTRWIFILLHFISGFATVAVAFISTIVSTACFEVKIYAGMMSILSLLPFAIGFMLQLVMDFMHPLIPPRSYFPVIEAVYVPKRMPLRWIRLGILIVYCVFIFILMVLTYVYGGYEGWISDKPCVNCKWKWDESIKLSHNQTQAPSNKTATSAMYEYYGCDLDNVEYGLWL